MGECMMQQLRMKLVTMIESEASSILKWKAQEMDSLIFKKQIAICSRGVVLEIRRQTSVSVIF